MVWGIGEGMFLMFQPLYLQQLGADPILIGGIIGLTGAAMSIVHLPAGYLSDRLGRRPLLVIAWFTGTLAAWVMAAARSLPVFVAGSVLYAMTAFVTVPMNSYITAARNKLSVGRALTLVSAIYNLGAILGPLLGGWIGNRFGLQRNFLVAAIIFILSSSLITLIHPQPVEPAATSNGRQRFKQMLTPGFLGFLTLTFLAMLVLYLPQPLTVNFLQDERGLDLTTIGTLLSIRSLGIVVLNLLLGQVEARTGFFLSQVAVAIFTALIWRGQGFPWYAAGFLFMGGFQTARALVYAQARALVQADTMGLGYGMIETALAFTIVLAPPLAGALYTLNPEWIYAVSLPGIALALLLTSILLPRIKGV